MKYGRNEDCFCGSGQKYKKCHGRLQASTLPHVLAKPKRAVQILSPQALVPMRRSCKLAANILAEVASRVKPGISTQDIDDWVLDLTLSAGAYPSPLNYPKGAVADPRNPVISHGAFPKSVCTSVNHVVCHGVPSKKDILKEGDIVNIDVTCLLDGYHGDTSRTVYVGEPGADARLVTETARECLEIGIKAVRPGGRLIEIGKAIYAYANQRGLSVVRDYTGHGIGTVFHADPQVCHYPSRENDMELVPGLTFTIEPMINAGGFRTFLDRNDKWTVYTVDGKLSAQFEHTVTVSQTGVEVLTLPG